MKLARLLIAAMFLVGTPALAQRPVGFGLGGGVTIPTGDFKSGGGATNGWHVQGSLRFQPPMIPLGFRVDGIYAQLGTDLPGAPAGQYRIGNVNGNLVLGMGGMLMMPARPYIIGGAGYYNSRFDVRNADQGSSNDLGFNVGAGVDATLAGFGAFVEGRYHRIMADRQAAGSTSLPYVLVTAGVRF